MTPDAIPFRFVEDSPSSASRDGMVVRIPATIRSKRKLMNLLSRELRLPWYFGANWDALEECLRDLSWLPAGLPVVIRHESIPLRIHSHAQRQYLQLLCDICASGERSAPRLQVEFPTRCREDIERILASPSRLDGGRGGCG